MTVWKDKEKGTWVAKFKQERKQYKKEGFRTRQEAAAWEGEKKRELRNPPPTMTPTISFAALANRYLDHCRARMQRNTWRSKSHYYAAFLGFLQKDPPIDAIEKILILDFLEYIQRTEGSKNANRHLKDLKALYNWGFMNDLIKSNPCKAIERFPEEKTVRYVPPAEDIDKVLLAADQEDMDLLVCLYHTGGRIGEIFRLTWNDVNFEKRWVLLSTRKRRGGELEEDRLAMSEKLYQVLSRRWKIRDKSVSHIFHDSKGNPYQYSAKRDLLRQLCEKADVKAFGFHAIRHHVASILEDSGKATIGQIQKFLRHRRKSTTEIYLHGIERDQIEVAKLLDEREAQQEK